MNKAVILAVSCLLTFKCLAQSPFVPKQFVYKESPAVQPFLFSFNTLTANHVKWNVHFAGNYGQGQKDNSGIMGWSNNLV
jgi:hypothetical protein